jgi:predicted transcriptional regulator
MNIQAKKLELVELVLKTDEIKILEQVANLLKRKADWRDGLPDEIIESVEEGLEQAKSGNTISHDEAMEKFSKWL